MLNAATYLLVSLILTPQVNDNAASTRMREVQHLRQGKAPLSAEYEVNGQPGPTFLGRKTRCRCYLEANGSFFVEEVCESWASRVWLFKDYFIWRYKDSTGEHAFIGPVRRSSSAEEFLEKKGFLISRMSAFDAEYISLIKSSTGGEMNGDVFKATANGIAVRVHFRANGFDIEVGSKPTMTTAYRVTDSLPPWKHETDLLLHEVESGKLSARKLEESFSFESVMSLIAEENAEEIQITPKDLPNIARVNRYILPIGAHVSVKNATSSSHGRWLQFTVAIGERHFECVQYRLHAEWNDKGDLTNEPISKNTIVKLEKRPSGELMLVSNGKGALPITCFIHRSGQTLAITGDFFEDKDFRAMIASLRSLQTPVDQQ